MFWYFFKSYSILSYKTLYSWFFYYSQSQLAEFYSIYFSAGEEGGWVFRSFFVFVFFLFCFFDLLWVYFIMPWEKQDMMLSSLCIRHFWVFLVHFLICFWNGSNLSNIFWWVFVVLFFFYKILSNTSCDNWSWTC